MLDKYSVSKEKELAEYAEAAWGSSIDIGALIKGVCNFTDSAELLKLNRVVGIVWCLTIIWLCIIGSFYMLVPLAGLAIGRTTVWGT